MIESQHDNNLPPIISALGLWNTSSQHNVYPLSTTKPNSARKFRASYLVAFRGYVALERMTCSSSSSTHHTRANGKDNDDSQNDNGPRASSEPQEQTFVRVRVDNAPVAIPGCTSGPGSTCPLNEFVDFIEKRGVASGDFVKTCGLQNQKNATSEATFLTEPGDRKSVV